MFSTEEHFTLDLVKLLINARDIVPPAVLIYLGKTFEKEKKTFSLCFILFSTENSELR